MTVKSLIAILGTIGLLAAVAGPASAQRIVPGSPIPSPIPIDPNTGHSLRHSRQSVPTRTQKNYRQYQSSYPRRPRFEPRSAEGYRQFYRGSVAPDFERRGRFDRRRRVIIIEAGGANIIVE